MMKGIIYAKRRKVINKSKQVPIIMGWHTFKQKIRGFTKREPLKKKYKILLFLNIERAKDT